VNKAEAHPGKLLAATPEQILHNTVRDFTLLVGEPVHDREDI
jgi:hypothetical protein